MGAIQECIRAIRTTSAFLTFFSLFILLQFCFTSSFFSLRLTFGIRCTAKTHFFTFINKKYWKLNWFLFSFLFIWDYNQFVFIHNFNVIFLLYIFVINKTLCYKSCFVNVLAHFCVTFFLNRFLSWNLFSLFGFVWLRIESLSY